LRSIEYDAIVLGLGGIGSAAAYCLARRGVRTLGLEQFELGHARGESHDHSRIIRLSYHTPAYVRLAKCAYDAWSLVEEEADVRLVHRTGGLDLGPCGGAIPLRNYAESMSACGVAFEELDAAGIRRRFPQFQIGGHVRGLFQADGGIVAAQDATLAHQRLAREHNADLREHARVAAIEHRDGEVTVQTMEGRYRAASLVIAAGPWTAPVLRHFGMSIPLEITKEQVMYFVPRDRRAFALGRFPVWIWMDDPSFYGFPMFGEPAVKVTQDAGGKTVDPDARGFEPDLDISARVRSFLAQHLPAAAGAQHIVKTCLYTLTPDRDFIIDTLPEHPNVHVAVGAGHAFKFASLIGRILSDLVIDGRTANDISAFSISRPILRIESPPRTYMV
jgi:sarcosine oxidase